MCLEKYSRPAASLSHTSLPDTALWQQIPIHPRGDPPLAPMQAWPPWDWGSVRGAPGSSSVAHTQEQVKALLTNWCRRGLWSWTNLGLNLALPADS